MCHELIVVVCPFLAACHGTGRSIQSRATHNQAAAAPVVERPIDPEVDVNDGHVDENTRTATVVLMLMYRMSGGGPWERVSLSI